MQGLTVKQKYSSLLQPGAGIKGQAEITNIGSKSLELIQRGSSWHGRLACWVKDNVSPLFRRKSQSADVTNYKSKVLRQFSADVLLDTSINAGTRKRITQKVRSLAQSGIPVRVKHLKQLLKKIDAAESGEAVLTPAKITNTSRHADQENAETEAGSAKARLKDGDTFTVSIAHTIIGGEDYEEALDKCAQGPNEFFLYYFANFLGISDSNFAEESAVNTVAELDEKLHDVWKDAVNQKVGTLNVLSIPNSQLNDISGQVIRELRNEIKERRGMNADDLKGTGINDVESVADEAIELELSRHTIVSKEPLTKPQKDAMRTAVLVEMSQSKISEHGEGRIYPQSPAKAFEKAVLNYSQNYREIFSPNQFTFASA